MLIRVNESDKNVIGKERKKVREKLFARTRDELRISCFEIDKSLGLTRNYDTHLVRCITQYGLLGRKLLRIISYAQKRRNFKEVNQIKETTYQFFCHLLTYNKCGIP